MAIMAIALFGNLRHGYGHLFGHVLPRLAMAIYLAMAIHLAMFYRAWQWSWPWPCAHKKFFNVAAIGIVHIIRAGSTSWFAERYCHFNEFSTADNLSTTY